MITALKRHPNPLTNMLKYGMMHFWVLINFKQKKTMFLETWSIKMVAMTGLEPVTPAL